jgi:thymidylate synthase ThyX
MPAREIYLLSPRTLSPETIAVAFAKTSRSPESFRSIAAELSDEKSAQFHEKWVVGYGHASVAEHAVLHLALENVSRLAIESIESNRLASYTEKSTRYQRWSPTDYTVPPELEGHPSGREFVSTCDQLFRTYSDSLTAVRRLVRARTPRRDNESEEGWDRRIRSQYVDACRFLLPAAANANLGMTANARVLEGMIRKMLSHELAEIRQIGQQVKDVARVETPTLIKYAEASEYLRDTTQDLASGVQGSAAHSGSSMNNGDAGEDAAGWCRLVDYDEDGESTVMAAVLCRFGEGSFSEAAARIRQMSSSERALLAEALLGRLGQHDIPIRELEYCDYTFEIVMDQGAYAEFKRHRMMTQSPQRLTTRLGFSVPRLITEADVQDTYQSAMQLAAETCEHLRELSPAVSQYVVPNGFHRRVLARFNLREAYHFCQLRAAQNAHFSLRRIAHRIHSELTGVHPLLTAFMRLPDLSWQEVERTYFTRP